MKCALTETPSRGNNFKHEINLFKSIFSVKDTESREIYIFRPRKLRVGWKDEVFDVCCQGKVVFTIREGGLA